MSQCEREGCKNEAHLSVGAGIKNNIHLCYECSSLPEYKRLRKRVALKHEQKPKEKECHPMEGS